jgi:hypothetical protein
MTKREITRPPSTLAGDGVCGVSRILTVGTSLARYFWRGPVNLHGHGGLREEKMATWLTTNKILGLLLIVMAFALHRYGAQSALIGFTGEEVSEGERLITWAILLTGGCIVWCLPSEPDKK